MIFHPPTELPILSRLRAVPGKPYFVCTMPLFAMALGAMFFFTLGGRAVAQVQQGAGELSPEVFKLPVLGTAFPGATALGGTTPTVVEEAPAANSLAPINDSTSGAITSVTQPGGLSIGALTAAPAASSTTRATPLGVGPSSIAARRMLGTLDRTATQGKLGSAGLATGNDAPTDLSAPADPLSPEGIAAADERRLKAEQQPFQLKIATHRTRPAGLFAQQYNPSQSSFRVAAVKRSPLAAKSDRNSVRSAHAPEAPSSTGSLLSPGRLKAPRAVPKVSAPGGQSTD